jgi:hypothetical protein
MKAQLTGLIWLTFILICVSSTNAQIGTDTLFYVVETTDGNEFIGQIVYEDEEKITLKTAILGEISIPRNYIKRMAMIKPDRVVEGVLWFENPQASRYFWAPNGYGLKSGEGYYQNIYVFYNQFSYGVSDYFSIGAGIVPLFLFAGASTPVWFVPKFSIPISPGKFNLGLGAMVGTVIGESEFGFGILYGTSTFGNRDHNFSLGIGWGYFAGNFVKKPLINASAITRLSARTYFISENYFIPTDDGIFIFSLGGRSLVKKISLDYMFAVPLISGGKANLIPLLGIAVPFG